MTDAKDDLPPRRTARPGRSRRAPPRGRGAGASPRTRGARRAGTRALWRLGKKGHRRRFL